MVDKADKNVSTATGLAEAASKVSKKGPPPVHLWNPPFCGDIDMEIRADGRWFYNGTPINRPEMVRLFSGILKREGDLFFLVTPVEKVGIRVVDAPFVAVDVDFQDGGILFTTNVGERITAGPQNAIRVEGAPDTPRPYVHVRSGLDALIDRKSFYRLVDAAEPGPDGRLSVRSGETWLPLET